MLLLLLSCLPDNWCTYMHIFMVRMQLGVGRWWHYRQEIHFYLFWGVVYFVQEGSRDKGADLLKKVRGWLDDMQSFKSHQYIYIWKGCEMRLSAGHGCGGKARPFQTAEMSKDMVCTELQPEVVILHLIPKPCCVIYYNMPVRTMLPLFPCSYNCWIYSSKLTISRNFSTRS